jgi:hypothetical protein
MVLSGAGARRLGKMRGRQFAAVAFVAAAGAACPTARAVDKHWNSANALWGNSTAWSPTGVPNTSDIVSVDFPGGGIASVNQTQLSPVSIKVFNSNTLRIVDGPGIIGGGFGPEAEDGQLGVGGDFIVGFGSTPGTLTNGTFSISHGDIFTPFDGQLSVGATMRVGMDGGVGTAIQNAGLVTIGQFLRVADSNSAAANGAGTYNLSGGTLDVTTLHVGYGRRNTTNFPNMQGTFNLSGGGRLITGSANLDVQIGGAGSAGTINQTGGTFISEIRFVDMARSEGSGGTAVWNYSGGSVSIPGIAFSNDNGTLNYLNGANLSLGQVQMGGGRILLASGHNKTLRIPGGLLVGGTTWKVDVNDNSAVLGTIFGETILSAISRGYNGGAWTGTGLTSTAAANDPQDKTGLGYGLASQVLVPSAGVYTFHGQTVTATSLIVKYTYYGDSNLDGQVDVADLGSLASHWQSTGDWVGGDFDYNGSVDVNDLGLLASNWQAGVGNPLGPSFSEALASVGLPTASVPEPAGVALVLGAVALKCHRRRRRGVVSHCYH